MSEQPHNHKEITALIKRISGQANFIGAPRIYIDMFGGDLVAAVWFNQVVYWDGKTDSPIGFYKTYAEWRKELGLSRFQVNRVAKECERLGLVHISFHKVYGTPKNHYLVIWPELLKILQNTLNKPDSEESDSSESEGSDPEESAGSKDSKDSSSSLSIEETTTNIDLDMKNKILKIIQSAAYSVFKKPISWERLKARLEEDGVSISGENLRDATNPADPMYITISGLSRKMHNQFTEAEVFEDRYYKAFANMGLEITFSE